ncbi:FKBP12-rapamycin complex-associated protein [Reticulomyxa filosa]|uniref:FKBP12-rapamycin complex-associated protein n=1 Tax=Reticulomyxa filosa TaxID=46433 RepID=X6MXP9_RETFI|nr:FKBP12-rapamycin complex-associated protein [Reticulomyxa filosa]|eukprot:ETO18366.1 FKBP12-rapamycin complex-associated protein [Reticulomyxa filosa]
MLIKAMEVSGIEGNYRTTCENTMRVLRTSKDSLMAILEAFVYDPLISFKLLAQNLMRANKNGESKSKKVNTVNKFADDQKREETMSMLRQSIVAHVLDRYNDQNDFSQGKYSRLRDDIQMQSVIQVKGTMQSKRKKKFLTKLQKLLSKELT